jgi:hypothetical protein
VTDTVTVAPGLIPGPADLDAALAADAARTDPEPPPRAPWLNEDGSARWGTKADGSPRKSRPGPGRGGKDGKARTETPPPPGTAGGGGSTPARSYREELEGASTVIWLGLAMTPPTRPYATLWASQSEGQVAAWDKAAQASPAVRGFVERYLAGGSHLAWIGPVALSTIPLAAGVGALLRNPELRAQLAAQAEADLGAYMGAVTAQVEAEAAGHGQAADTEAAGAEGGGE